LTATYGLLATPPTALHVPVGSRSLMQRFGLHLATPDPTWTAAAAELDWALGEPARALRPRPTFAVVLGGAAEALVQVRLQAHSLRLAGGASTEGAALAGAWLESAADQLRTLDAEERAALPGVPPDRADTLTASAALLLAVLRAWNLAELVVTERN